MILYLASDIFLKGGIQRYARAQIKTLADAGLAIYVFSASQKNTVDAFEDDVANVKQCNTKTLLGKIFFSIHILNFCLKNKPSLIVVNHVNLAPLSYLLHKFLGIKYVLNVYGIEIWSGLSYFRRLGLGGASSILADCHYIENYIKVNNLYSGPIQILYDPVDTERFKPDVFSSKPNHLSTNLNLKLSPFIVMTVGRLVRNKGHKLVISALTKLPMWNYVIVGDGVMRSELQRFVKELNLDNRVLFTGRIPEIDLVSYYNSSDVIALISNFDTNEGEGLPLGLIEGAACGKPLLAGSQDGSLEAINIKDPNGFLVGDVNDVVSRLSELENTEIRESLGQNGLTYVRDNFSYNSFSKKFFNIIRNI